MEQRWEGHLLSLSASTQSQRVADSAAICVSLGNPDGPVQTGQVVLAVRPALVVLPQILLFRASTPVSTCDDSRARLSRPSGAVVFTSCAPLGVQQGGRHRTHHRRLPKRGWAHGRPIA